jgi:DNA polymerase-3 subunit alpha
MFYQLQTKTSFNFYQSSVLIDDYASRANELHYGGIAITDSNLYGYPALSQACEKYHLKPIYGFHISLDCSCDFSLEANLYVLNEQGYLNLCKLLAEKKETYSLPLLSKYHDGLALIVNTDPDYYHDNFLTMLSKDFLAYKKVFQDNFYFGISLYSLDDQNEVTTLYEYCKSYDYNTIAFPKCEYVRKIDAYKKNLLMVCKNFDSDKDNIPQLEETGPYFLLSEKALASVYRQEDIKATEDFYHKIDFTFFKKRGHLVTYKNEDEQLKEDSIKGLLAKLHLTSLPKEYEERLNYELSVIKNMHFSSYFLIVDDYVRYAKNSGIKVGPGRGSAGGSLVAYALDITQVDPLRFDLTFERFLNPNRVTMPDIDIDFEDERRNEVVSYLKKKYGEDHISDIVTFVKLKPKSCLNMIGPVLGVQANRLKKLTQSISDKATNFKEAKDDPIKGESFTKLYQDPYYQKICDIAESLMGLPINTSIHAPGAIISQDPIYITCPVRDGKTGTVLYEYPNMEQLGFLKVDILALSNLTFLKHIEEKIVANKKELPDIYADLDNPKVYQVLNQEDVVEIFQLDTSYGMRKTIRQIKPSSFTDLAATIALFRPGPMDYIPNFAARKHGKEKISYADTRLKDILDETYGIMVYQEQIMKAVQVLAGFSLGEADLFRRAISKKQISKMEAYKTKFIDGCKANKITQGNAENIFADIEKFAQYGFNKAHAYAYGLITYSLLYYKTFYPIEFYSTALEMESFSSYKVTSIIEELRKRHIKMRNPNINISLKSGYHFSDKDVYLPLNGAVHADKLVDAIDKERGNGPFTSFYDFAKRMDSYITQNDYKAIYSLIDGGCFDSLCKSRVAMKNSLDSYLGFAHFDYPIENIPPLKDDGEDIGEMLYLEKMALGKILSVRLPRIFYKEDYHTFIVTDTSALELANVVTIDDENRHYRLYLDQKQDISKYDFILVKGNIPFKDNIAIHAEDVINCNRKVVKHE